MTIPQQNPSAATGAGRNLASAVAVFLGGYLLLASLAAGQLNLVSMNLFASFAGRPVSTIPASIAVLLVLQFLFAIAVVVTGLLIGRGPLGARFLGSALVVVGSLLTFGVLGARNAGLLLFPSGQSGIPFQMLFANAWFAVVLVVGVAWLLGRRARLGWLSILGVVVLIPLPVVFALNGIEFGVTALVLYAMSALVGAGIIAAGRPWRD